MTTVPFRLLTALLALLVFSTVLAYQQPPVPPNRLADPFSVGWMLTDTNGDGVVDFVPGKVVVSAHPSAAENAAAADIAARLGFGSTGLTPPIVISSAEDRGDGPRIYVGRGAVPSRLSSAVEERSNKLQSDEGGVFAIEANLAVLGHDDAGLLAAAQAFAARAPYIWRVPGERLTGIAGAVDQSASGARASLTGVTYLKDKLGINRAFLEAARPVAAAALETALNGARLGNVHELVVTAGGATESAVSSKPMPSIPAAAAASDAAAGADAEGAGAGASRPRDPLHHARPVPRHAAECRSRRISTASFTFPPGAAESRWRIWRRAWGLKPPASRCRSRLPPPPPPLRDVRTKSVIVEGSEVGKEAARKLREEDTAHAQAESALAPAKANCASSTSAFGRQPAVLVRGDESGASAAWACSSDHFPNLWEPGKQYLSHRRNPLRSASFLLAAIVRRAGERSALPAGQMGREVKSSGRRAMSKPRFTSTSPSRD